MTKPIDWTRPLRVVGTHEPVKVFEIEPCLDRPIRVGWVRDSAGRDPVIQWIDRDGRSNGYAVENAPPEPRIVERWAAVRGDNTAIIVNGRGAAEVTVGCMGPGARIARVLIEEPGE